MNDELISKNELLERISNIYTAGIFASDMKESSIKVIVDMPVRQAKSFS